MFLRPLIAAALLALVGCASPTGYHQKDSVVYDDNTEYHVEDHSDGFTLTLYYSRFQFFPESSAVAMAAKSHLTSIAHEIADKRGKQIEPINEQRIKMSMGRNAIAGLTTFSGEVRTFYKK